MKRKHKNFRRCIISFVLMVAMVLGAVPVPGVVEEVRADPQTSGDCGDGLTWSLSGTDLTISKTGSGTGAMTDYGYSSNQAPWKTSGITSVTIGSGVTSIGDNAFVECATLQNANIPNGVTSIGTQAFTSCTGLTSISIPNSVGSIGQGAFGGCNGLSTITISGNGSTTIGSMAFWKCTGLESVTIGAGVQSLGYSAFANCSNLTTVHIGDDVTSIGTIAFNNCSSLETVTIGKSLSTLGRWVFGGSVPATCNIIIDPENPNFSGGEFIIDSNGVLTSCVAVKSDCVIPNTVTSIADAAFAGKTGLVTLTIPSSVTSIGQIAFSRCTALTSATFIGGGVTTAIGVDAFNRGPLHIYARPDRNLTGDGVDGITIKRYYIGSINATEHGTVTISGGDVPGYEEFFTNGGVATLTATPEAGYVLATVTVTDQDSASISVNGTGNTRTFTMPSNKDATVSATFLLSATIPVAVTGLVYNGNVQTGVAAGMGYTLTGNTATDAGDFTATATLQTGYLWSDGTSEPRMISWSIAKRPLTIKAKDQTVDLNGKIAGDVARAEITDGTLAEGDSIAEIRLTSTGTENAVSDGTITAAAAVIKNQAGEDVTANYDISYVNGNLTVGKGEPSVTAPAAKEGLKSSDAVQALVTAGKAEGGEMFYALGKDDKTAPAGGWSKEVPTAKDAGNYYVWYKVVGDKNHKDTEAKCVTVIMLKGHTDLKAISLSENITVKTGETMQLIVTYSPADATDKTVEWKSSDTDIATVDASGNVKGIKAGYTVVSATAKDGGYTASCKVEVSPAHTDDNAETTWISDEDLKDYKIPEEKKPEYMAESIKIGSKNDSKEVKVSISMNYMDAVTYNGKALTPKTSDEFKFELKLDDILTQAGVSGVKAEEIFKVSFVGKSKDAGEGTFYAKVSLVPKSKSKFKLTKQQEKDLKKIISAVNKVLKNKDNRVEFKINKASIAGLTDLQVYAKLTKDGKLTLNKKDKLTGIKSVKYKKTPADAKYTTLSKKAGYSVEAVDINTLEVRVTGTKNYTGWTTVKVSK